MKPALDPALLMDNAPSGDEHGPHHSHASEGTQLQGWPEAEAQPAPALPLGAPRAWAPVQPPSADLVLLIRPPQLPV